MNVNHQRSTNHRRQLCSRSGVAVVIVLGLLAITLALSYAMIRSQYFVFQIQHNSQRGASARQAALTGVSAALKTMHQSDWQGVGTTLTGDLSSVEWYEATFATGDSSLSPGDPDYDKYPYRVTITSTGFAEHPDNPNTPATHTVTVVVELVPRQHSAEPSGWNIPQPYTLYQWKPGLTSRFEVEAGFRAEGRIRVQRSLKLWNNSPAHSSARQRWLADLNQMRLSGEDDNRPFDGDFNLSLTWTDQTTRNHLANDLGLTVNGVSEDAATGCNHPGVVSTYKLYPGGAIYTVPTIGSNLNNTALEPDPLTNPLGVFFRDGRVDIQSNVSIQGTLIIKGGLLTSGNLHVFGTGVTISPVDLPILHGATAPSQLPVAIVQDNLRIEDGAHGNIDGCIALWDEFELKSSSQDDISLTVAGKVLCQDLIIRSRTDEWNHNYTWWNDHLNAFLDQLNGETPIPYFPAWLEATEGLRSEPVLTVKPESSAVTYHWQNWSQPVFVPHADDDGMRWDIIDWRDNP